jgi:phosphoribosylformylglycinamidine synthase
MLASEAGDARAAGGVPPALDPGRALSTYRAHNRAVAEGLIRSSHTLTQGGLAVGLALCSLAGGLGAHARLVDLPADDKLSDDARLFAESNSRFIVSCRPEDESKLDAVFAEVPHARIGTVSDGDRLVVEGTQRKGLIDCALAPLEKAFKETLHGQ